jgi:hypothetical protein
MALGLMYGEHIFYIEPSQIHHATSNEQRATSNEQRATNVENEKQDEHQHQHHTVITIKTLFYIML